MTDEQYIQTELSRFSDLELTQRQKEHITILLQTKINKEKEYFSIPFEERSFEKEQAVRGDIKNIVNRVISVLTSEQLYKWVMPKVDKSILLDSIKSSIINNKVMLIDDVPISIHALYIDSHYNFMIHGWDHKNNNWIKKNTESITDIKLDPSQTFQIGPGYKSSWYSSPIETI